MLLLSRPLRRLLGAGALFIGFLAGCDSGPRPSVEGSVQFDGQKVTSGAITFIPLDEADSVRATGKIRDGSYYIDSNHGPNPGQHRVEIHWRKKTGNKVPGEGGNPRDETVEGIPSKYHEQSELTVTVAPGRNKHNFDLTK